MEGPVPQPKAIEIRVANVDLTTKLDALGAALAAIREAHRDEMSVRCWAEMNKAQEALAAAIICANEKRNLAWTSSFQGLPPG